MSQVGAVSSYFQHGAYPSAPNGGNGQAHQHYDLAAVLTLGMFALNHSSSQLSMPEQLWHSTERKWKRKAVGAGAEQLAEYISSHSGQTTPQAPPSAPSAVPSSASPSGASPGASTGSAPSPGSAAAAAGGSVMQQATRTFSNRVYDALGFTPETRAVLAQNNNMFTAYSAAGLFGLGRERAANWTLGSMWQATRNNFADARLVPKLFETILDPATGKPLLDSAGKPILVQRTLTLGGFLKYGVGGELIRRISMFLGTGQGFFEAAMGAIGLGFLLVNTGLVMKKAHDKSAEKGEGLLTRIGKTIKAGVKETLKSIVAVYTSSVAYALTYAAITAKFVGAAAAMGSAAVAGVLCYYAMTKLIGSSVEKDPGEEDVGYMPPFSVIASRGGRGF